MKHAWRAVLTGVAAPVVLVVALLAAAPIAAGVAPGVTSGITSGAPHDPKARHLTDAPGVWAPTTVAPPSALPSGLPVLDEQLNATSCSSNAFCVSVGYVRDTSYNSFPLVETYSAGTWTSALVPTPGNIQPGFWDGMLNGVSCPADGQCAAVGLYYSFDPVADVQFQDPLLATLTNGSWSSVPGGMPFGIPHGLFNVSSVSCPTVTFCSAAGTYSYDTDLAVIWDWTPTGWTDYVIPLSAQIDFNVIVSSISCSDPVDCVVVGSYVDSSYSPQALIITYASGTWTAIEAPLPANATSPGGGTGTDLDAIDCPQSNYCVAAGRYTDPSTTVQPLLDVLSSGVWSPTEGPVPADAVGYEDAMINGVYCPTEGTCVATGGFGGSNGYAGMILSQSGSAWSAADAPLPPGLLRATRHDGSRVTSTASTTSLAGVGCDASGFCVSGGTDGSSSLEETGQLPGIPTITDVTPDVGATGSLVTVSGTDFSPSSQVVFGTTPASTTVVGSTELRAVVPSAIPCGTLVTVSSGGLVSRDQAADRFTRAGCRTPGPPSKVKAAPGHARATVSFKAPSMSGGEAPTTFEVVADDLTSSSRGGQTVVGTSSPITVTGLMPGDLYTFAVSAANSVGSGPPSQPSDQVALAIAPLTVVAHALAPANIGGNYDVQLHATGGFGSLTWNITAGALPDGLQLSSTGQVSGTVATDQTRGTFSFTVSVTDLHQPTVDTATATFVLRVR